MNKFWKGTLINIAIIYGITLISAISGTMTAFLFVPLIIAAIQLVIGLILLISDGTRQIGQIMLAASGIVLLIGLGLCSVFVIGGR